MKKVFLALVTQTVGTLLGMAAWSVQAQMLPGPFAVPTDGGGTPIYANQEGYYGLSGGCSDGKCGYRVPRLRGGCSSFCSSSWSPVWSPMRAMPRRLRSLLAGPLPTVPSMPAGLRWLRSLRQRNSRENLEWPILLARSRMQRARH